jgi:hypothetical protein
MIRVRIRIEEEPQLLPIVVVFSDLLNRSMNNCDDNEHF